MFHSILALVWLGLGVWMTLFPESVKMFWARHPTTTGIRIRGILAIIIWLLWKGLEYYRP